MAIERSVVKRTQRDSVRNHRCAHRIAIGDDVRRFWELLTLQSAHGAMSLVRLEHTFPKLLLMQPLLHGPRHVPEIPNVRIPVVERIALSAKSVELLRI